MFDTLMIFMSINQQLILYIAHAIIFVGGFYIALVNKVMPKWLITCLWYIGLSSLFSVITLAIEWFISPQHPMSYSNLKILSEFLPLLSIAITISLLFINTFCTKIKCKNYRKSLFKFK